MLAKRIVEDPVEAYRGYRNRQSSVYRSHRARRKLSIHARFVAQALDVFADARIVENIAAPSTSDVTSLREVSK